MNLIITKVENNRVAKYLPVAAELAQAKLAELLPSYPNAFIYAGEYMPDLFVDVNSVVSTAPVKTLVEVKADKNTEINKAFELAIAAIKRSYPADEIASWPKQEAEARAFQSNSLASTPLIDALALSRGVTKADLVARIIAKSDIFANISGNLIGKRQKLEDTINALSLTATKVDVDAIVW